ncbi:hypothetical protein ZIOFF_074906 [Zingiber officinale]|uniref:DUF4283 domain-containing protein n=1 Tax=Zingiber officinale TaxID=94328 RepID=A0A8J5BVY1_ZINOF|nr:hypothetical protein ZIOFF_074906 [Zingiber officinale]
MAAGDSMPPGVDLSHPSHFPPLVAANLKPVESLPQSSQEANPVHPSSYAAALRPTSPRASKKSFEDVGENFKQPSIYNNKPGIFYTKEEVNGMSKPYQFSLIGKFSGLRPRPQIVFQAFKNIGLFGLYDIRFLHAGYIFLHFSSSEDMARMARVWTRGIWFIGVPKYCTQCFHLGHLEDACYANGNRPNPLWKSEKDGNDGQDLSVGLNRRNAVGKQEVTGPFESDEGKKMLNKSDGGKQVWIKNGEASEQGMVDKKGSESRNSFHVLSTLEEEDKGELEGLYEPPENVMYPWGDGYVDTKIGQNQLGPLGFQNLEVEEQKLDKLEDAHLAAVLAPAHVDSQTNVLNVEPRMDKGKSVVGFSKQRSYNSIGSKKTGAVCAKSKAEGTSRGWSSSLQKQSGPVGLAGIQDSGQWGNFSFSAMQDEFEGNEVSKSFMEEDDSNYGEAVDSQRSSSFPLVSNPKGPLLKTSSINVPSGVTRMVTRSKSQFLHLKLCSPIFPISIMVTVVYAKCNRIDRRILWDDVSAVKPVMDEYWPMGRDFNAIIGPNEHSAGSLAKCATHEFNNFLMLAGLLDVGFVGDRITWTNGKVWKWLDRILVSPSWSDKQYMVRVEHLSKVASNHCPLFISFPSFHLPMASFRSLKLTQKTEGPFEMVECREMYWKQKVAVKWIGEGERNTKFFHNLVQKKRMTSLIFRIWEEGVCLESNDLIQASGARFFEELLIGEDLGVPVSMDIMPQLVSSMENQALLALPSIEEVKQVVWEMCEDSAVGPNGFSVAFYVAC